MSVAALGVGQLVGDPERLDTLLVGQQPDRPGPVRAPQATLKTVRLKDLSQGLPDVGVGEWLVRQGARPGNLDGDIVMLGKGDDLAEIGKGLWRSRRLEGLPEAHVIHDHLGVWVPASQFTQEREFSPTQHVYRKAVPCASQPISGSDPDRRRPRHPSA